MNCKIFFSGLLLLITISLNQCGREEAIIKIITINLRDGTAEDGENHWDKRKSILFDCLNQTSPGIIATQEGLLFQLNEIKENLIGFEYFGMGRYHEVSVRSRPHEHRRGEHCAVFYDSSRLALDRCSTFWLSDTPNVPGSMTWGNDLPRIVTWGIFRHKQSQKAFALFNTHYHPGEPFVSKSTHLLLKKMAKISGDLPKILVGDFNLTPESGTYKTLTRPNDSLEVKFKFVDVWSTLNKDENTGKTFHGFTGVGKSRLDWILVTRDFQPQATECIDFKIDNRYPSDHFPVMAKLGLPK